MLSITWTIPTNVLDQTYAAITYVDAADVVNTNAIGVVAGNLGTHEALNNNPHTVNKTQVGLSDVTNDKQLKESDRKSTIVASGTDIPNSNAVIAYVAAQDHTAVFDPIVAAMIFGDS